MLGIFAPIRLQH